MLGKFAIKAAKYGEHCVGVFFRRSREDLKEAIERSRQIYPLVGAKWHEQKKWWTFPNGARLKFEYLDRDADADNYQGHNYTDVFFEELTHWPDPKPVNKLRATLRSAVGVPCQFHATGNPGGPGHHWVRARYIDPDPVGGKIIWDEFENPWTGEKIRTSRVFIPSKLWQNKYLGGNYVANLYQAGSKELVRAWLEGDWSVIEGAFFDCWSNEKHVLRPFEIPSDWLRFRSGDWGSASPFSVGWWAVCGDDWSIEHDLDMAGRRRVIPRGALIRYREWYGKVSDANPRVGLKLTAEQVAAGILERERGDTIKYGVLDPSAFAEDGGPSIAERMAVLKAYFHRADNKRVTQKGALGGWDQMRARLVGDGDGRPMIYCFSTCVDSIRTIPALQHDPDKPEDLDTDGEDHAADEWRYACMSRPWIPAKKADAPPKHVFEAQADGTIKSNLTVRELIDRQARKRRR
jgi:hypothetical protein